MAKGLPLRDLPQDSVNNCDGCQAGIKLDDNGRHISEGKIYMACSKHRYTELSKEEEVTLHDYALKYASFEFDKDSKKFITLPEWNLHTLLRSAVKSGAAWQKEQDKELIKNLLEIVNVLSATIDPNNYTREFKSRVRDSVVKAEKY